MKRSFLTEYRVKCVDPMTHLANAKFGGVILARSLPEAKRLAKLRNIGERVCGDGWKTDLSARPNRLMFCRSEKKRLDAIHGAIYLGWLAVKSLTATVDEVFGDEGTVHDLLHVLDDGSRSSRHRLSERLAELENAVPGSLWGHP